MRALMLVAAVGLLAGIVVSTLELASLATIESGLASAEEALARGDLVRAGDELAGIGDGASDDQRETFRSLVQRLLTAAAERHFPVVKLGGRSVERDRPVSVAYSSPLVQVSVQPAGIRHWVQAVHVGKAVASISEDGDTVRLPVPITEDRAGSRNGMHALPVRIAWSLGDETQPMIDAGTLSVVLDLAPPRIVLGREPHERTIASPPKDVQRVSIPPGQAPQIAVRDDQGLRSVRWDVAGRMGGRDFTNDSPRRWQLPLDERSFAKDGSNVAVTVEAINVLGNSNRVRFRFAVRTAGFNPVAAVLVDGRPATKASPIVVRAGEVEVRLRLRSGEASAGLAIRSGGRRYALAPGGDELVARLELVEQGPTGFSILRGTRVLASYRLQVEP